MELIVKTDMKTFPEVIEFNFEEIKTELAANLEKYQNAVITEDGIKDGKSDRAKLNKLKEAIETERKRIKATCLEPYNAFEKRTKELVGMIDQPILAIDTQIKQFEEAKREEKRAEIEAVFSEAIGELAGVIKLENVFDQKWLNATVKIKAITEEIQIMVAKFNADLSVIDGLGAEYADIAKDKYLQTLDLGAALAEGKAYEERKKALEAIKAEPVQSAPVPPAPVQQAIDVEYEEVPEETKDIKVIFYATTAAFREEMKALTVKHGIKYGGIK